MILTLQTAPTTEPITLTEAKSHCRVTSDDDDTLLTTLIKTARLHVEGITNRSLITQTWDLYLSSFCDTQIILPRAPLSSVTSVSYYDTGGALQVWDSSNYVVDTDSWQGRIYPVYNGNWPSDVRGYEKDIVIRFVAGYGAASAVPNPIKHAILLLIGELYENREMSIIGTSVNSLPFTIKNLLSPYSIRVF